MECFCTDGCHCAIYEVVVLTYCVARNDTSPLFIYHHSVNENEIYILREINLCQFLVFFVGLDLREKRSEDFDGKEVTSVKYT